MQNYLLINKNCSIIEFMYHEHFPFGFIICRNGPQLSGLCIERRMHIGGQ